QRIASTISQPGSCQLLQSWIGRSEQSVAGTRVASLDLLQQLRELCHAPMSGLACELRLLRHLYPIQSHQTNGGGVMDRARVRAARWLLWCSSALLLTACITPDWT